MYIIERLKKGDFLRISDNMSTSSIRVNKNEFRMPQQSKSQNNTYKDAFKLDINPRFLDNNAKNEVQIANSDDLYYSKSLDVTPIPY